MQFTSALVRICKMTTSKLARRSYSPSVSDARAAKRRKIEHAPLTPDDYRNGVMLAPMVRSGARTSCLYWCICGSHILSLVPTRLFALKHGAKLVWSPEIVDKAILHCERKVDRTCVPFMLSMIFLKCKLQLLPESYLTTAYRKQYSQHILSRSPF